ncbi:hypothetical protein HAX54_047177 [Datura stramonium]|uniref:Uncharacterized protein n=1 Tax=Datura stramonium TaxID=4076 RepID=A0ABS8SSU9_DATST|nr:hypothetical protein [Datura stramonium]
MKAREKKKLRQEIDNQQTGIGMEANHSGIRQHKEEMQMMEKKFLARKDGVRVGNELEEGDFKMTARNHLDRQSKAFSPSYKYSGPANFVMNDSARKSHGMEKFDGALGSTLMEEN